MYAAFNINKNVWFCSYKIRANVSKFSREDDESRAVKVKINVGTLVNSSEKIGKKKKTL
jgi:hypothetical protein